jgi:hypothetical protein
VVILDARRRLVAAFPGSAPVGSPNGRRLAFQRRGAVVVASANGIVERVVGRGRSPSWVGDGNVTFLRPGCGAASGVYVSGLVGRAKRIAEPKACLTRR